MFVTVVPMSPEPDPANDRMEIVEKQKLSKLRKQRASTTRSRLSATSKNKLRALSLCDRKRDAETYQADAVMPTLGGIGGVIGAVSGNAAPFFGSGWGPKVLL
jgi:hypothetical protein